MEFWILIVAVTAVSFLLTGMLRRYALARSILDVPNDRSSHLLPTPRGGGLAIVLSFIAALAPLCAWAQLPVGDAVAIAGSAGMAAAIGFLDDHGHVPARWRLLVHFVAAAWALALLPPSSLLALPGGGHPGLSWLAYAMAGMGLVWLLNLYNFMDGINGIAAGETLCVCTGGAVLAAAAGAPAATWAPLALAGAAAGFMVWNFPRGRIFMGDVGSGALGMAMGVLALQAGSQAPRLFWAWIILLGVFIGDASWTLLRRLLRGERVHEAHRTHAYQYAARRWGSHVPVTLAVMAINLCWLLPVALLVVYEVIGVLPGLAAAYVPLLLVILWLGGGRPERPTA